MILILILLHSIWVLYLFEGFPKLSSRSHAQLLSDVRWNFEQENLHEARHQPILTNRGQKVGKFEFLNRLTVVQSCVSMHAYLTNGLIKPRRQKRTQTQTPNPAWDVNSPTHNGRCPSVFLATMGPERLHIAKKKKTLTPYSDYTVPS